ncbi:hypothetical protein IFM89_025176 [Coptis chinensis]|uniref:Uncharacterized protein n=1 Tax=Coptis chinensis TaxID=261450 RepID=A0A835HM32_9MAGN|nr:hypothetical protein IFM89_025176 [Coptis chinensis]
MSGTPKRLHEEVSHSSASKHVIENANLSHSNNHSGKLKQLASNEYHPLQFESGQDGRSAKVPRTESRDVDRRSPMHPLYRTTPPSNDSYVDHHCTSENRVESRDYKDSRDPKVDNRDFKGETRDMESHMEFKGDVKIDKDAYNAGNSPLNWKDPREQHRGKRYPEAATDGEENEFVVKSDDKLKDKDRKKKGEKHRDWGERDKDRIDRRSNLPLGNSSSEHREITREERESERWERDRKDIQKEKERPKEREKDHIKKETLNGIEKEGLHNEKESADGSIRTPELENPAVEQRRQKEHDGWKADDRESKDRKKERDVESEGDRHEKRGKCYDKESDEGLMEGDGGTEKEREGFSFGVQQRKRMLRPRGSQINREPRFRSRSRDNEESQDKPEVSTVVYKVGECMQELIKLWKEFEASQEDKNVESSLNGPTLEIRIPAEYVTATNRQVRGGQLWGTDIYTDDSDLVAVLMHTGYCRPTASPPPSAIQELRATIRVMPPQDCYTSTLRNNVRSRAWGAAIGCSYRVERCCIVKKGGGSIDLEPCLTHTSSVEPTLAPVAVERTMTTRAAASNALRQQRFVREVTIQYNLCNEPWIKYSISIVADKGLKKPLYTSARLKKGEVLYLETHSNRYELCYNKWKTVSPIATSQPSEIENDKSQAHTTYDQNGERTVVDRENTQNDVFRWARCKKPLPQNMMRSIGIPLPLEYIEVLEENLDWEDVQWSQTGVLIAGKEYPLARVHFLSPN